ncbi:4-hydroxy-3-methylbut-2-enyl diphosphate reductase [Helicobacter enhydrae]|uniref:4-hydroxy-3-methylbut-2-enyl diphosphate reductase n=1 Tax=Helicobacter enhydrae TaxID=222136 RepID=A0A1B1U534_9HELI|nr:4-hydroxy-3-methylbut-2-enyl diphosphate reductase [Helicobacter enhydrae]ANV97795.1 4-hydroxy-3-methylbut-2-enyl diphosphate reductase [Helicobacter enhydrae]
MKIKIATNCGFCFGVKRAIEIAEKQPHSITFGALIHNQKEINRLQQDFGVKLAESLDEIKSTDTVIVRTHGIQKDDLLKLQQQGVQISDATCPYVKKPQKIAEKMSEEGYQVVIFGDAQHPEVKGVVSYASTPVWVIKSLEELKSYKIPKKIALISQTTKQREHFFQIANYLIDYGYEVRVFNTICSATFENQDSARELAQEADIMIVVGGLASSNTKQLFEIAKMYCQDSYLIEDENDLNPLWFANKTFCGITAGASTPDWIIQNVKNKISTLKSLG